MPDEHECQFKADIKEIKDKIAEIHAWAFTGNGKDPINIQVDRNTTGRKVLSRFMGAIVLAMLALISKLLHSYLTG